MVGGAHDAVQLHIGLEDAHGVVDLGRSLIEAVLWHGGEAQPARDAVVALPTKDREALIAWLASL